MSTCSVCNVVSAKYTCAACGVAICGDGCLDRHFEGGAHPRRFRLNMEQRIVAGLALLVSVVMLMFPPWVMLSAPNRNVERGIQGIVVTVGSDTPLPSPGDYHFIGHPPRSTAQLDMTRLLVQLGALWTLTGIFVWYMNPSMLQRIPPPLTVEPPREASSQHGGVVALYVVLLLAIAAFFFANR